ncbi:hypothetical protein NQ318_004284 [Aromia moschata]|uniref:Uncharacterized protein n=1 Tax=Aromia moschata TaxID=1265417 RepID=A0AAV8YRJ4_9CUCU|nr:hypothetical protein NQ318_004284 [Aromia moschata]
MEQLVTKEYFVRDRANRLGENERRRTSEENFKGKEGEGVRKHRSQTFDDYYDDNAGEDFHDVNIYLQSTEDIRPYVKDNRRTPTLSKKQIHEMLIEDRLDQLETVLPHYTRRRVFETSTITITKVISNRRAMATLTVKNCVPQGYEFCSNKIKREIENGPIR